VPKSFHLKVFCSLYIVFCVGLFSVDDLVYQFLLKMIFFRLFLQESTDFKHIYLIIIYLSNAFTHEVKRNTRFPASGRKDCNIGKLILLVPGAILDMCREKPCSAWR
jgi:hypothetical protein